MYRHETSLLLVVAHQVFFLIVVFFSVRPMTQRSELGGNKYLHLLG